MKCLEEDIPDSDTWENIKRVENVKRDIPLIEEKSWRLKSVAVWLKEGDKNSKFFHVVANGRKFSNAIWQVEDAGASYSSTTNIQEVAV